MKQKINIKENGKIIKTLIKTERNELHFEIQKKCRSSIKPSKKVYNRKAKYKKIEE